MGRLLKGIAAALAMGLALPALADNNRVNDTAKNVGDSAKNTADDAQDKLGTDSGTHKAKRHAKKHMRNAKKSARAAKNDAKDKMDNKEPESTVPTGRGRARAARPRFVSHRRGGGPID